MLKMLYLQRDFYISSERTIADGVFYPDIGNRTAWAGQPGQGAISRGRRIMEAD